MKKNISVIPFLRKNLFISIIVLLLSASIPGLHPQSYGETNKQKIYIIPVSGDIDPAMASFIKRSVKGLPKEKDTVVVFEMDTFGGRVDSALEIVDSITGMRNAKTIAYIKTNAISAGALISLACKSTAMNENTTIGDCAPIAYSAEGPQMLDEKHQSPLRAKFRALARLNGYPSALAESMVSIDMEVYRIEIDNKIIYMDSIEYNDLSDAKKKRIKLKRTVIAQGQLLTMDNTEAQELGFSMFTVAGLEDMLLKMNIKDYELVSIEKSWSELLVSFLLLITPILLLVGMGAIYTELKSPGFGIPGIIGIVCLALAFGSQYMVGLADYTDLLIIAAGIVLVGIEIFVLPGFGIAGILGFLFIVAGMILALQDFTLPDPSAPWEMDILIKNTITVFGSLFLSFFVMFFTLRYLITRIATSAGPYLSTSLSKSHADSMEVLKAKVNDAGIAATSLRPSGKMKIGDNVFDVIAEGEYMEKGTPIKITQIKGNRIIISKQDS
ncbi:MAG: serine protease [Spirochaetes bacterium]|nr:serine protease [Spirochaetota bacterium]